MFPKAPDPNQFNEKDMLDPELSRPPQLRRQLANKPVKECASAFLVHLPRLCPVKVSFHYKVGRHTESGIDLNEKLV